MPITPQPLVLNPLKDAVQVDKIDYRADFDNLFSRTDNFHKFFKTGKISYNMLKYIPGLAKLDYQGQLYSSETKRKYADDTYKGKKKQLNLMFSLRQIIKVIFKMYIFVFQ